VHSHPLQNIQPRWRHSRMPRDMNGCPFKRNCAPKEDEQAKRALSAVFVHTVSIADDAVVAAGTEFAKIWRIRNNGNIAWPEKTVLSFVYGDRLGSPAAVQLPNTVAPGGEVDAAVTMVAPSDAGKFSNYWRLCEPEGAFFGPPLWARIVVEKEVPKANPVPVEPSAPAPVPVVVEPTVPLYPVVEPVAPVQPLPPVPVAPVVPEATDAERFTIGSLKAMGFVGDLLSVLRKNRGDIEATLNELLG